MRKKSVAGGGGRGARPQVDCSQAHYAACMALLRELKKTQDWEQVSEMPMAFGSDHRLLTSPSLVRQRGAIFTEGVNWVNAKALQLHTTTGGEYEAYVPITRQKVLGYLFSLADSSRSE